MLRDRAMADCIQIKDLLVRTIIGINDEERVERQDVLINIDLYVDTACAAATDDIENAVNYRTLTKQVIALVENSRFYLLERLAEEVAKACLAEPRIERVRVSVEKPGALRFARSVAVVIERARQDGN